MDKKWKERNRPLSSYFDKTLEKTVLKIPEVMLPIIVKVEGCNPREIIMTKNQKLLMQ